MRDVWLQAIIAPPRLRAAAATRVRTSASRGGTRPVSHTAVVRRAGVVTWRGPRVAAAPARRAGTVSLRGPRVAAAPARPAGTIGLRGPRVVRAAAAVTACGPA